MCSILSRSAKRILDVEIVKNSKSCGSRLFYTSCASRGGEGKVKTRFIREAIDHLLLQIYR